MMEIDRIYCEDCLEGMKRIPSGSVDAVICDLPYGVLNKGNKHAQWDTPIPLTPLWEQYRRVIKPSSPVILFAQGMFTAELMMSQRGMWRYNLVWMKNTTTGFLNANRMPLRKHEDILVFYQHLPVYHPQMKPCAPGERNHINKQGGTNRLYGKFTPMPARIIDSKYPTSIIEVAREHKNGECYHPTQKPVALVEYLIRTFTNEGDLVLDNCMGSGTTAVAAIRTNRHFIGFETNKEFYEIACNRLRKESNKK